MHSTFNKNEFIRDFLIRSKDVMGEFDGFVLSAKSVATVAMRTRHMRIAICCLIYFMVNILFPSFL